MTSSAEAATSGFRSETIVRTRGRWLEVQALDIGVEVLARCPESGETGYRANIAISEVDLVMGTDVFAQGDSSGEWIVTTDRQSFWVRGRGWIAALELRDGDVLELAEGGTATVKAAWPAEVDTTIHSVEVDGLHALHVGQLGVLVHD